MKPSIKTAMKCKFSNQIHEVFNSLIPEGNSKSTYWEKRYLRQRELSKMSDSRKIELFNQILSIYETSSSELANYRAEKRNKKQIAKLRKERGYVPKKKTTKEQWNQMQQTKVAI